MIFSMVAIALELSLSSFPVQNPLFEFFPTENQYYSTFQTHTLCIHILIVYQHVKLYLSHFRHFIFVHSHLSLCAKNSQLFSRGANTDFIDFYLDDW